MADVTQGVSSALPTVHVQPRPSEEKGSPDTSRGKKTETAGASESASRLRPIPRTGLPLLAYYGQRLILVVPKLVGSEFSFANPRMTKHDHTLWHIGNMVRELKKLSTTRKRKIVVLNSKGGAAKTPTTAYLGGIFQEVTNESCVILDLNQNIGTMTALLDIPPEQTLRLNNAIVNRGALKSFKSLAGLLAKHEGTGIRFLASEDIDMEGSAFEVNDFVELINNAEEALHSAFIDTGNGMSHPSNRGSVSTADALVFPGLWDNDVSMAGIAQTMFGYVQRGFAKKVFTRSYIVINAVPKGVSKEKVFKVFSDRVFEAMHGAQEREEMSLEQRRVATERYLKGLNITLDRFYIVPYVSHIKKYLVMDVEPATIGLAAREAFLEILSDIYRTKLPEDPEIDDASSDVTKIDILDRARHRAETIVPDGTPATPES